MYGSAHAVGVVGMREDEAVEGEAAVGREEQKGVGAATVEPDAVAVGGAPKDDECVAVERGQGRGESYGQGRGSREAEPDGAWERGVLDEVADSFAEGDHAVGRVYDVEMGSDDSGRSLGRTGGGDGGANAPKGQYDDGDEQRFHGMKNRTKLHIFHDITTCG